MEQGEGVHLVRPYSRRPLHREPSCVFVAFVFPSFPILVCCQIVLNPLQWLENTIASLLSWREQLSRLGRTSLGGARLQRHGG